jgi:DNA-binding winged helix-turn-helix (wHTH) protein
MRVPKSFRNSSEKFARVSQTPTSEPREFIFGPFRMDIAGQRLWHEGRAISLRPKSWDVLRYLLERPGLLVTKADLHREVWQNAAVVEDTLTQSIGELRRVLGDDASKPRFIETAHRRGFRFIANVCAQAPATSADLGGSPSTGAQRARFVGRETELNQLHEHLRRARQGVRQLVFITGEAGIGKTTLVDEFLRSPRVRDGGVSVFHGQCVPLQGPREPYMPILEALERVLRSPEGAPLVPLLQRVAPCWYLQMPSLLLDDERLPPQGETPSRQRERMLREINTFLEEASNQRTVILVLEDLHWTDTATTDVRKRVTDPTARSCTCRPESTIDEKSGAKMASCRTHAARRSECATK